MLADLPHVIAGFAGVVPIQYGQCTLILELAECPDRMIAVLKTAVLAIDLRDKGFNAVSAENRLRLLRIAYDSPAHLHADGGNHDDKKSRENPKSPCGNPVLLR